MQGSDSREVERRKKAAADQSHSLAQQQTFDPTIHWAFSPDEFEAIRQRTQPSHLVSTPTKQQSDEFAGPNEELEAQRQQQIKQANSRVSVTQSTRTEGARENISNSGVLNSVSVPFTEEQPSSTQSKNVEPASASVAESSSFTLFGKTTKLNARQNAAAVMAVAGLFCLLNPKLWPVSVFLFIVAGATFALDAAIRYCDTSKTAEKAGSSPEIYEERPLAFAG